MESTCPELASPIFRVPLEIRELILSHLLLPQHAYVSSGREAPDPPSVYRSGKVIPTYVDSRIYFPSRMPVNLLHVCKQLREESLAYHARCLNSSRSATVIDPEPLHEATSPNLSERNCASSDASIERLHDEPVVRITLEVLRLLRVTMGYYTPERREPSPRFIAFAPLLCRLKKIKFTVWAGYEWWSGESMRPIVRVKKLQKARLSRVSADQEDRVVQPALWEHADANASLAPRPNPLGIAIDALLKHLPLVEQVNIDLLMHDIDYWNWDLPETWWEGIREWLDGPISSIAKGRVEKVDRKLIIVYHGHVRDSGTLLHQRESLEQDSSVVRVERGFRKYEDDWDEAQQELSFTEMFERAVCLPSA